MVVFGENRSIRGKVVVFGQKWLFGQSGCIRAKWLYSGKSGCIRAKVVVFGQNSCILAKMFVFW